VGNPVLLTEVVGQVQLERGEPWLELDQAGSKQSTERLAGEDRPAVLEGDLGYCVHDVS
jgi:hypothetical protein